MEYRFFKSANGDIYSYEKGVLTVGEREDAIASLELTIAQSDESKKLKLAKAALNESSDADYLEKLERVAAAELLLNSKPELVELEQVMSSKCVKSGLVELSEMELISHLNSSKTVDDQISLANTECTRRINEHWNQVGQINASLGIYGEEDTAACAAWISANREALIALLDRDDLTEIDVSDDQYWPSFEG